MRRFVSQPSELCAGAAFALAGFSSGRGDCARGGWAAGRCVPAGMSCARLTPAVRFCWNVLRSVHACLFSFCQEKRDGLRYLAFLFRGSRSPFVRSRGVGAVICLCGFTSGLAVYLWRSRRGYRGRGVRGVRSRRRGVSALSRNHIGFAMFSAGSTLGLRAPDCAKESSTLWTLFIWVAAWVRLARRGRSRTTKAYLLLPRPAALGYTERLARVRFMLGQVGLYSDDTYKLKRPDSSRPQAARSRVDTREAERPPALPA